MKRWRKARSLIVIPFHLGVIRRQERDFRCHCLPPFYQRPPLYKSVKKALEIAFKQSYSLRTSLLNKKSIYRSIVDSNRTKSICRHRRRFEKREELTNPCLSEMLLVSLSLWKEIIFCIHCSPVAGLSG